MTIGGLDHEPSQSSTPDGEQLDDADELNPSSAPVPYKAHTSSSRTAGTGLHTQLDADRRRLVENILLIVALLVIVVGFALLAVGGSIAQVFGASLIVVGGVAVATLVVLRVRARVKRGKRRHTAR